MFEYEVGTGFNNTQQVSVESYFNRFYSSSDNCPISNFTLTYYNETQYQELPYDNQTVTLYSNGSFMLNTTNATEENIFLNLNTANGTSPYQIKMNVTIMQDPVFSINHAPFFESMSFY